MKPEAANDASRVYVVTPPVIPSSATQTTERLSFDCRFPMADLLPARR